jgi:hypothetical protein
MGFHPLRGGGDMKRREFMILLGATAAWPRKVTAQNAIKVYRVGSLNQAAPIIRCV